VTARTVTAVMTGTVMTVRGVKAGIVTIVRGETARGRLRQSRQSLILSAQSLTAIQTVETTDHGADLITDRLSVLKRRLHAPESQRNQKKGVTAPRMNA
jgi:hypothetical protein